MGGGGGGLFHLGVSFFDQELQSQSMAVVAGMVMSGKNPQLCMIIIVNTMIMNMIIIITVTCTTIIVIPHPRCGLLDFRLLSSPTQPQSVPGVPNPRVSLERPTLDWSAQPASCAQPQSVPGPNPKECPGVPISKCFSECPTPECPWSAQPQSVPGVSNPRGISTQRGWGCSKQNISYC